jgi:hypothetical protein
MTSQWQMEAGHLVRRWAVPEPRGQYSPSWMREVEEIQSGYLQPVPDFASHSPFGGPCWFHPADAVANKSRRFQLSVGCIHSR